VCPNTFSLPRYAKEAVDQQRARIDGIVATIVAIGRAMVAREEPQRVLPVLPAIAKGRRVPRVARPVRGGEPRRLRRKAP
jgi:hypothetical protein